jgi:hypothetical protein
MTLDKKLFFKINKSNVFTLLNNFVLKVFSLCIGYIKYDDLVCYTPRGIRIPVSSVKRRGPRPLDDGGNSCKRSAFIY